MAAWSPLEAVWAKYERGLKDMYALRKKARDFIGTEPYPIEVELEPDSGCYVAYVRIADEPPPALSVLVGSVAYQCYSALNHVVWELVGRKIGRRKVEVPQTRQQVQFPIAKRWADLRSLCAYKNVSKPAQAILRELQPYKRPAYTLANITSHPFFLMKNLADLDKHRVLAASYGQGQFTTLFTGAAFGWNEVAQGLVIERLIGRPQRMLKDRTPVVRLRFDTRNAEADVYVKRQPPAEVIFSGDEWGLRVRDVVQITTETGQALERLATLFRDPRWPPPGQTWPSA